MAYERAEPVSPAVYLIFALIVLGLAFGFGYVRGMKRIVHEYDKIFSEKFYGIGVGHHLNLYPRGLVVSDVYPGTPAEKAGIQKLDLILNINYGNATTERLSYVVASGATVRLKIRRRNRIFEVLIKPELMQREIIVAPAQ